jgi:hypothetical protein
VRAADAAGRTAASRRPSPLLRRTRAFRGALPLFFGVPRERPTPTCRGGRDKSALHGSTAPVANPEGTRDSRDCRAPPHVSAPKDSLPSSRHRCAKRAVRRPRTGGRRLPAIPLVGGFLYVDPIVLFIPATASGLTGSPGAGAVGLPFLTTDPAWVGPTLDVQAGFIEAGAPFGVSLTNGLMISLG